MRRTNRQVDPRVAAYSATRAKIIGWVAASCLLFVPAIWGDDSSGQGSSSASTTPWIELTVEPAEVVLHATSRQQELLVTARHADGRLVDVTRQSKMALENSEVARVEGTRLVGRSDGTTVLSVSAGGLVTKAAVRVQGIGEYPPIHFASDIVPILSKLGCNSGGCHGRASGQNGFKLSVFGFDPAADYNAIVKQSRGRRVFPPNPEKSLILSKPSGIVPHGGGLRLTTDSQDYQLLLQWITQGMPLGDDQAPRLVGLRVSPTERELLPGGEQQILAMALYSDNSSRDVTTAAYYASNAPHVGDVNSQGLVRCGQVPGEVAITVNYMGQVAAVQIHSPRPDRPEPYPEIPAHNEIDPFVWSKLRKMGLTPSDLADDATFLRRSTLDCLGTLPTPEEARSFLTDPSPGKRSKWIEGLLEREEYADYWALKWADILLVDREKLGIRGAYELHGWLRDQFRENRPYDVWVRELVTASGDSAKSGPANFFRACDTPDTVARTLSQAFLGVRIECAQCHHHPFEKWSQRDYYGLAAFFNGMGSKTIAKDRALIFHRGYQDIVIPDTNETVPAHGLDAPVSPRLAEVDPREVFAVWMTAPENPWFARLAVNRVWKNFFNRGLVESEDDLRSTNPPTNAPLLDFLAQRLIESKYDLKSIMRLIMNSRAYQLSSEPNANNREDEQNFSHYYVKRLPAEVLLDGISQVTGVAEAFPGRPYGTRALSLFDNRLPSYFLEIFGRPERTSPCECGRSSDPTMAQSLHLMNAPEIEAKISDANGRVARLISSGSTDETVVDELCLAAIGRYPDARHRATARKLFDSAPPREAAEDFLWTLLNSYDFLLVK